MLLQWRRGRADLFAAARLTRPGYSAIRATVRVLEEKGHIRHEQARPPYNYVPKTAPERAKRSALKHLLNTLFAGRPQRMAAALLDVVQAADEHPDRGQRSVRLSCSGKCGRF